MGKKRTAADRRHDYEIGHRDGQLDAVKVPRPQAEDASADFERRGFTPRPPFVPTVRKESL